jgi:hypothetical protein
MSTVDNLIAFKVLSMLVTPFEKSDAFRLGIIDKDGKALKKVKDLKTSEERDSYTALDRLVFNLKKLLAKVPGGKSQFASLVAAYWLIKESENSRSVVNQDQLLDLIDLIETKNITFVEEEIEIEKFFEQIEEDGIVNVTGAAVSTDIPVIKPGKKPELLRRKKVPQNA